MCVDVHVIPAFAVNVDGTVCAHGCGLGCMREKHGWDCRRQNQVICVHSLYESFTS